MTTPSDPDNKPKAPFPRPQDAPARPAVVVGGPAQAKKNFKATMVGVAPPAAPVVKGLGSSPLGKPPSAPRNAPPSAPGNAPPSAPQSALPGATDAADVRRAAPREPPKRPPPFKRAATMMGLSPPGAGAPAPHTGEPLAEPIHLESEPPDQVAAAMQPAAVQPAAVQPTPPQAVVPIQPAPSAEAVAPPPGTLRMGDVPVAMVTRQGSEPEIGSVELALESVVAAGDRVAAPMAGMGTTMPEAAYTRGNRGAASGPVEPTAATEPAPQQLVPQQLAPQQLAPQQLAPQQLAPQQLAPQQLAPQQLAPQQDFGAAPFAAPPGAQPFGVQLQQAPPEQAFQPPLAYQPPAPIPVQAARAKKKGGGAGLVLGLVFGVLLLAGGALALVAVLAPESQLGRTLRSLNPLAAKAQPTLPAPTPEPSVPVSGEAVSELAPAAEAAPTTEPAPSTTAASSAELAASVAGVTSADTEPATDVVPTTDSVAGDSVAADSVAADSVAADSVAADSVAADSAAPAATAAPAEPPPSSDGPTPPVDEIPPTVNQGRMEFLTNLAVRRAEQCHLSGRAVGTAMAFITFAPDGKVVDARLEGEPIASAPVATCILNKLRAVVIKPYEGPPFTHSVKIRLK